MHLMNFRTVSHFVFDVCIVLAVLLVSKTLMLICANAATALLYFTGIWLVHAGRAQVFTKWLYSDARTRRVQASRLC